MDALSRLAGRLDDVAATLAGAERVLPLADPGPAALGAAAPGRPGEIGRALHARLAEALGARTREAAGAARRLADAADTLRGAAARYADVDDAVRRRHEREA